MSLLKSYPEIAIEWDYDKNSKLGLSPENIAPHSDRKVWWKCKQGHSYCAKVDSRTQMKSGCPYCAGKMVLVGYNDLETMYPEIAAEWDYENNEFSPSEYMPKSNKIVNWICPICRQSYKRKILERTDKGFGCKYCMGEKHTSRQEQTIIYYISKIVLVENRKKLFGKELDVFIPSMNIGIEYNGEYYHSGKADKDKIKYNFLRSKNIRVIVVQCGRQRSIVGDVITLETKEKCNPSDDEYKWGLTELFRILGLDVPDIDIKRDIIDIYKLYINAIKENSIVAKYLEIAKEWNYELNKGLKPESFAYASNKRVWWTCSKCGSNYDMVISNRTIGNNNCPYCSGKRIKEGLNDLATTNPELVQEWNYEKNDKLPQEYVKGSDKKVWWKCNQGHEWEATISSRTVGGEKHIGCPVCAGRKVVVGFNNLGLDDPEIIKLWNYGKNTKLPCEYTKGSNKKVWWKCDKCGHEWQTAICSISRGRRCPECAKKNRPIGRNKTFIEANGSLEDNFPELLEEWDYEKNEKSPCEYLSGSHKKVWWKCKKCRNSWLAMPYVRTQQKQGCPECGKQQSNVTRNKLRLEQKGTLANKCPELVKEWDFEKNEKGPECYTKGSKEKVWWKCENGHSWQAVISSRTNTKCGCPVCAGRTGVINLDTGERFETYVAAAKSVGVTRKAISFAVKNNTLCKGYRWRKIK